MDIMLVSIFIFYFLCHVTDAFVCYAYTMANLSWQYKTGRMIKYIGIQIQNGRGTCL